jgi:hypothetical protein
MKKLADRIDRIRNVIVLMNMLYDCRYDSEMRIIEIEIHRLVNKKESHD